MKILHITLAYEPAWHLGGVVRAVSQLCRGQAALGHQVTVYATDSGLDRRMEVPTSQPVDLGGVRVYYFPAEHSLRYGYSPALRQMCRSSLKNFDIIHLASPWAYPGIAAGQAARRQRLPYVMSAHGSLELTRHASGFLKKWLYMNLVEGGNLRRAAGIHFTSELERTDSICIGHQAPSWIVPNGVDIREFDNLPDKLEARIELGLPADRLLFLYFGRLEPRKALDVLVKAFAQALTGTSLQTSLCLAGPDFGQQAMLQNLARELGISEQVIFTGYIPPGKRKAILAAADLLALVAHRGENFGISALEGMLAGVPALLSTNVGFYQDAVAAGAAVAVPVEPGPMSQALSQLLAEPTQLRAMGQAACSFARSRYDNKVVAASMVQAYEDILSGRRSPQLKWSCPPGRSCFIRMHKS
jgi:glycosyltransferase involved in cell wall biosynthesis